MPCRPGRPPLNASRTSAAESRGGAFLPVHSTANKAPTLQKQLTLLPSRVASSVGKGLRKELTPPTSTRRLTFMNIVSSRTSAMAASPKKTCAMYSSITGQVEPSPASIVRYTLLRPDWRLLSLSEHCRALLPARLLAILPGLPSARPRRQNVSLLVPLFSCRCWPRACQLHCGRAVPSWRAWLLEFICMTIDL